MKTKPPALRRVALTAVFAVVCVALLIGGWLAFTGPVPLQAKGYRVTLRFDEARNVLAGAEVQSAGVRIGRVTDVRTVGADADVTVEIKPRYVPLHVGTRGIVRTKTLLGEGFVDLSMGPRSAPAIPERGRLPRSATASRQQLDEVLGTFSAPTRRDTRSLLAGMAEAFDGRATELGDAIGVAGPTTANVRDVLDILDAQQPRVQRLIADSGDVLSALGEREGSLQAGLAAGNRFLAATASRRGALAATVRALPPFLRTLRSTTATLAEAGPELDRAMTGLRQASAYVAPALREVEQAAPTFERTFRRLGPATRSAVRNLPAVERIAKAATPALRRVYPASRELIPIVALLAVDRHDFIGILSNIGNITNGRVVGPGGKTFGQGTGVATVWNEVIGGYKKKLPTNRPNPYFKPGGLQLGTRGYLQSFSCDHTGNRLLVPVTGTGAPPCEVQGPWTFRKVSKSFPDMSRAAP